jgi:hypothetical protein
MSPTTGYAAALDSDDLIMSFVEEAVWGTIPTSPVFKNIRLDGEGFTGSKDRTRPNEIDPAGQASAAITTKEQSVGNLNFSVSVGVAFNTLLAASLGGTWGDNIYHSGTDFAVTTADVERSKLTLTCTSGAFLTLNPFVIGQFVKLYSSGSSANCGIGRIKTVDSATQLTIDCFSGTPTVANAGTMGTCSIKGQVVRNGIIFNSFTFQKKLSSAAMLRYSGSFPTGGSLEVGVGGYLQGTMDFLNASQVSAKTELSGASYTATPTRTVIDSINGIGDVWRTTNTTGKAAGIPAVISAVIQKISVKWTKENAAAQFGIGSASARGMRKGKMLVNGALTSYFNSFDLYDEFVSELKGPISFYALDGPPTDANTRGYMITFCNASIMNPKIVCGGSGQDVMAEFEIEGNPDDTTTSLFGGKTIQIDYFGPDTDAGLDAVPYNASASSSPSSSPSPSTSPSHSPSSSPSAS